MQLNLFGVGEEKRRRKILYWNGINGMSIENTYR